MNFDPLNPDPAAVRAHVIAHNLSHICRFGGSTKVFYSVAQHSLLVASLMPNDSGPWAHLLALLHDAAEAYVGDMITPLKYHPEMRFFRELEQRVQDAIHIRLVLDEGATPEDLEDCYHLVKEADLKARSIEAKRFCPKLWSPVEDADVNHRKYQSMEAWPSEVARERFLDHYLATVATLGALK